MTRHTYTRTIPSRSATIAPPASSARAQAVGSAVSLLEEINRWAGLYAEIKALKNINKQIAERLPAMLKHYGNRLPKGKEIKFHAIFTDEGNKNYNFAALKLLQQRIPEKKGVCSANDVIIDHSDPVLVSSELYLPLTVMLYTDEQIEFSKKHGNGRTFGVIYTR